MPSIASFGLTPARFVVILMLMLGCGTGGSAPSHDPDPSQTYAPQSAEERMREGPAALAGRPATPPYFRIEGRGGANLLVLGSIHFGPPQGWRFSSELLEGLEEADSFVLEIDLRKATPDRVANILASRVVLPVGVVIEDVLSPQTNALLSENEVLLTEFGLPVLARRRLKPWFLAVGLVEEATVRSGYSTERSVEQQILEALEGRPLMELETFEAQLAMLDSLSVEEQDVMLRDTVGRLDETVEGIGDLALAWAGNDQTALEQVAYQGIDALPALEGFYDTLLGDRNRDWIRQLSVLLDHPSHAGETIFVAVGALHLVGRDSLIQMFEAEGYRTVALHPKAGPSS